MFKQLLQPRPFAGAFQHALRSRWSPIAPSSRIDHRLAAFELAEKDIARRLTALTLAFVFNQALIIINVVSENDYGRRKIPAAVIADVAVSRLMP